MKKFSTPRGFTMVELLLYMGIYSILLVVLLQIFTSILSVHAESRATSSVNQDGGRQKSDTIETTIETR